MKVLYHVDEGSRWGIALGNVENMLRYGEETGLSFEIEVLANGPAVTALRRTEAARLGLAARLESLAAGARFCACRNALRANAVAPQELLPFVQVVPAGVVELAARQEEGYSYIKP